MEKLYKPLKRNQQQIQILTYWTEGIPDDYMEALYLSAEAAYDTATNMLNDAIRGIQHIFSGNKEAQLRSLTSGALKGAVVGSAIGPEGTLAGTAGGAAEAVIQDRVEACINCHVVQPLGTATGEKIRSAFSDSTSSN